MLSLWLFSFHADADLTVVSLCFYILQFGMVTCKAAQVVFRGSETIIFILMNHCHSYSDESLNSHV